VCPCGRIPESHGVVAGNVEINIHKRMKHFVIWIDMDGCCWCSCVCSVTALHHWTVWCLGFSFDEYVMLSRCFQWLLAWVDTRTALPLSHHNAVLNAPLAIWHTQTQIQTQVNRHTL
jgi:hypothetical protein